MFPSFDKFYSLGFELKRITVIIFIILQILNSTIRFWAPPGKQPIPYVSIPFNILFECLDLNNVLFVWYALTLENKVLLVSSQSSLLTLCAEILSALLFPMEWSHLYIPILPLFLSQMLGELLQTTAKVSF